MVWITTNTKAAAAAATESFPIALNFASDAIPQLGGGFSACPFRQARLHTLFRTLTPI